MSKQKRKWRLADDNPGSDIGVTFADGEADDGNYDREPDIHVFSVHVWHAHSDECREFARELVALMNKHGVQPPKGWLDE
jgi:hypothetical protein